MDKIAQTQCYFMIKPTLNEFVNPSPQISTEGTAIEGNCDIVFSPDDANNWQFEKASTIILYEGGWLTKETGHFLYLHKDQKGIFTAFWNGGGYSSHAHTSLNQKPFEPKTIKKLQCWENDVSQICFNENVLKNGQ